MKIEIKPKPLIPLNSSDLIEYGKTYKRDKTVVGFEEEAMDKLIKNAFRYELTDAEIKNYLLDFLRSYRWHVIERSQQIGASAIHHANIENKL